MKQLEKTKTKDDYFGNYITDLPDEWDTETSMLVRLYQHLSDEGKQNLTYRKLINMNKRGYVFLRTPEIFKKTINILRRKGVILPG